MNSNFLYFKKIAESMGLGVDTEGSILKVASAVLIGAANQIKQRDEKIKELEGQIDKISSSIETHKKEVIANDIVENMLKIGSITKYDINEKKAELIDLDVKSLEKIASYVESTNDVISDNIEYAKDLTFLASGIKLEPELYTHKDMVTSMKDVLDK